MVSTFSATLAFAKRLLQAAYPDEQLQAQRQSRQSG